MTRKDFEGIATALRHSRLEGHGLNSASQKYIHEQWEFSVRRMADFCARQNPRFDRARFLAACWADASGVRRES